MEQAGDTRIFKDTHLFQAYRDDDRAQQFHAGIHTVTSNTLTADLPSERETNILDRRRGVPRDTVIIGTQLISLPLRSFALIELAATARVARAKLRR